MFNLFSSHSIVSQKKSQKKKLAIINVALKRKKSLFPKMEKLKNVETELEAQGKSLKRSKNKTG